MRKGTIKYIIIFSVFSLSACSDRVVCPAFQSAFILDKKDQNNYFSTFGPDSLPKGDFIVHKDRRGLVKEKKFFFFKKREKYKGPMIAMNTIYPSSPTSSLDSLSLQEITNWGSSDNLNVNLLVELGVLSSYNRDQKVYDEIFGETLVPTTAPLPKKKEKKGFWRIFKRKKKRDNGELPESETIEIKENQELSEEDL
ncbi:hypothetical protein [Xanthovirga aplysinae]|uniref:hypothetical protein n=1 Tax=Xanthovirga aplysinae TaxID=2529853 RepID=UPI0012BBEE91|nr:hypothetical protein [Xanthovirga aplysinae]MTI31154.1 hypothetical protein [Xanthovirga aplysinae]